MNALDPERRIDHVEAVAYRGDGVFETLKLISKLTLRTLRRRMTGEEPLRPTPAARVAQFRVQSHDTSPARTIAQSTPTPNVAATAVAEPRASYTPAPEMSFDPDATVAASSLDRNILTNVPVAEPRQVLDDKPIDDAIAAAVGESAPVEEAFDTTAAPEAPIDFDAAPAALTEPFAMDVEPSQPNVASFDDSPEAVSEMPDLEMHEAPAVEIAAARAEPDIDFNQTDKPQKVEEVKTVKVRSSVDVMAELEALRKRATNTGTKTPKRDILADLANLRPKRDLQRSANLTLPADILPKAKSVRVTLSFEDAESGVIETRDHIVELGDTTDAQSLSVNLKIDLA
jgi:hypothetical protein